METTMGYVIEYSKKNFPGQPQGNRKTVICDKEKLIWLLQRPYSYTIWKTVLCDIVQYQLNHEDVELLK